MGLPSWRLPFVPSSSLPSTLQVLPQSQRQHQNARPSRPNPANAVTLSRPKRRRTRDFMVHPSLTRRVNWNGPEGMVTTAT